MKYVALVIWLLSVPFVLKSFGLLPYGMIVPRLVYSWNGGMTISAFGWRMIYREHGWPIWGRVPTFSTMPVAHLTPEEFQRLSEQFPDWQERLARGENLTVKR